MHIFTFNIQENWVYQLVRNFCHAHLQLALLVFTWHVTNSIFGNFQTIVFNEKCVNIPR